jgi:alpha-glucosidase
MNFRYVHVNEFTPNLGQWTPVGDIPSWHRSGDEIQLDMTVSGMGLRVSFLGPRCFRVRFRPVLHPDYTAELSRAVVERDLELKLLTVRDGGDHITADTGALTVRIDRRPYRIQVFRDGQRISADVPSYNLVYIPSREMIANFKTYPANARYCGFGEKAGAQLFKNQCTMTFFNFDNFMYTRGPLPQGQGAGPLNPSEPLYCSVPLLIEVNPDPIADFRGPPYAYGIFFDNPSQSFVNIGASDYSNMDGKYYFGALYGEMDYYFMAGDDCRDVLAQYTTLTGRAPMPPKYVFGFHQGAYGYCDHSSLSAVAAAYRAAWIPLDGLHIDIDFEDNYRAFTHSEKKFPDARRYLDSLRALGFKCSTNVGPLLTTNILDETGNPAAYPPLEAMMGAGALLAKDYAGGEDPNPSDPDPFYLGRINYGMNLGSNPYSYPPLAPNASGQTPLGVSGRYCDFSREEIRRAWGEQYRHLIQDLGMDMIWQDMNCPAVDASGEGQPATVPLALIHHPDNQPPTPHAKIHNVYALDMLKATWDGIQRLRQAVENRRNFIIARGGFAGVQRYAGIWTGDTPTSWDYLSIYVPQVLNLGLSGIPIAGADIGGFANGSGSTPGPTASGGKIAGGITGGDLFTRWMHVGAFLPWYRNHYNGYTKQFQEVYAYGEPILTNCRKYVELRYRMLQVFYDAMYEWTQTGLPVSRALFLNDPHDPEVYRWADIEFFVGRDVLVAPVVTPQWNRPVYLPAGSQWYAFQDNRAPLQAPVPGGGPAFDYYAPLDLVPIYIRAGAILPMRELEQYVGQLPQNPLTLNVYPGPDSIYRLYQDDGITCDAQDRGTHRLTEISHRGVPGGQDIRLRRLYDRYRPSETYYFVALPGTRHPSSVTVAGAALPDIGSPENLAASPVDAYYWNAGIEVTFIKVFDTAPDVTVTALFDGSDPGPEPCNSQASGTREAH